MQKQKRNWSTFILVWTGLALVIIGIYFWLGLPAALICAGGWFVFLGIGADIVQGRTPSPTRKPEEPKS
jgi:hypothetical protein